MNTRRTISATVLTLLIIAQLFLAFLLYNEAGNSFITNLGWISLSLSAVFGWLPIFTLRKWGGLPEGKGYMHTTSIVDRGVYAIVRHPQYLAGMLMSLAFTLITQHWLVAALGTIAIAITYADTFQEEASAIEKFGDQYREYMQRVPRINFLLGAWRLLAGRK